MPRKNSTNEKIIENNKINEIFLFANGPIIKVTNPKNRDKNNGTKSIAKIIKFLNSSSCVNEMDIQYKFVKKYDWAKTFCVITFKK